MNPHHIRKIRRKIFRAAFQTRLKNALALAASWQKLFSPP
jgi:hypothetical protein